MLLKSFLMKKYEISPMELNSEAVSSKLEQQKVEWNLEWAKVPDVWKKRIYRKRKSCCFS